MAPDVLLTALFSSSKVRCIAWVKVGIFSTPEWAPSIVTAN